VLAGRRWPMFEFRTDDWRVHANSQGLGNRVSMLSLSGPAGKFGAAPASPAPKVYKRLRGD
jgi:hypothetical protein